jgi:ABC-2 type transport system permease protein
LTLKLDRVLVVALKTLRSLRHDRRTIAFVVLVPLLMISLFGYTFGGELKDIKISVVNLDEGVLNRSLGTQISEELQNSTTLQIQDYYGPGVENTTKVDEVIEGAKEGRIWAAVVFEEGFSAQVLRATFNMTNGLPVEQASIKIYLDASNPNIAQAVVQEVQAALQQVLVEDYHLVTPISLEQEMIYGEDAEFIDFFAPGVMGLAALMVTFMLSIVSFVHERSSFTLERVLTSPITEGEFVAGYALAFGLVGLAQSTVILLTAMLLFQVQIVGSALLVLVVIFTLGVGTQGLGFLLSSRAKSEFQALQFMPLVLLPSILLAGVFWPLEAVPELLQPISALIPLTYAVEACRSVMIRGWGIAEIWPSLLILTLFAVAMLLLSAYSLKKRG